MARETRLIVGPWAHAETVTLPDGVQPLNYRLECLLPSVAWFDRHLKATAGPNTAPVRIYTMGVHRWRAEEEWPLAGTAYTSFFLQSRGNANTATGDGTLTQSQPNEKEPPDTFDYDPQNPVPSAGGAMLGPGPAIQRQNEVEARADVLVYSTDPLKEDLEVTGPIDLDLYVATSAPCTDFTAKLVDVFPDGSAYNVSEGVQRRRYEPSPSKPTRIVIELWPTSIVFLKGHRIRLEVSSSSYPRFDRNPNTGRDIATECSPESARQTVFHGRDFASRPVLPVIP